MWFLTLLVWCCYIFLFCFGSFCLTCGLYYLAEIIEEYTRLAGTVIRYTLYAVCGIHVLMLFFEDFPASHVIFGLLAHATYFLLLGLFPYIELSDPRFIASCVMALLDHCLWFRYFTLNYYDFGEILSFFVCCVWLIPFGFFISLSANENTLPTLGSDGTSLSNAARSTEKKSVNRLLSFFSFMRQQKAGLLPEVTGSNTVKMN
mmetsp:Transcript_40701/g.102450  ORF Transcript_40701/g.102450 Transcript_40701/m.102450 type:complete len:204 (-) Transcript_40701:29-640(-)